MVTDEEEIKKFEFLTEKALSLGATNAKIIPVADLIVENRVPVKCRAGCITYGKKLTCPPYVPTPDEFRKVLAEYRYALLVKFISPASADPDIISSIYKYWLDPEAPADKKEKAAQSGRTTLLAAKTVPP
jgi:predicted metal-binding protein